MPWPLEAVTSLWPLEPCLDRTGEEAAIGGFTMVSAACGHGQWALGSGSGAYEPPVLLVTTGTGCRWTRSSLLLLAHCSLLTHAVEDRGFAFHRLVACTRSLRR